MMKWINNVSGLVDLLQQPWHWAFSGVMIALVLFLMTYMGKSFGVSTSYQVACSVMGAGKRLSYFQMDLKKEGWRIAFVAGGVMGGFIAATLLRSEEAVAISQSTIEYLATLGIAYPASDATGAGFVPTSVFNFSPRGILLALAGGIFVGFGARYANGCTSGHTITGIAHLQMPSVVTTIGFFIGGLLMTHFIFPWLMSL